MARTTSRSGNYGLAIAVMVTNLVLAPPSTAQTTCIDVSSSGYEAGGADMGVTPVEWFAELSNGCEASYDADIEIAFVDEAGNALYKVSELVSVPRHGHTSARREVYIPTPDFERVGDMRVRILAQRERPF
jgi:hypothetical protein